MLVVLAVSGCDRTPSQVATQPTPSSTVGVETVSEPSPGRGKRIPHKRIPPSVLKRSITVEEAVARLEPHVDVPIVLPHDRVAGLWHLDGWLADPKYLEWGSLRGVRGGTIKLQKEERILFLHYGLAGFDGCGGRDTAIETDVLGAPALLDESEDHEWSTIIWPVTKTGSVGRYGIDGTFAGWKMVRLAESMEAARLDAVEHERGC
jgi:hypothetical protein